jgi:hypothetical protein
MMHPACTSESEKAVARTSMPRRLAITLSKTLPLKGTMVPSGRTVRAFTSEMVRNSRSYRTSTSPYFLPASVKILMR